MKDLDQLIRDIESNINALKSPKEVSPFRVKDDLPLESIKRILKAFHQVIEKINERIPDAPMKADTTTEKKLSIVNKLLKQ